MAATLAVAERSTATGQSTTAGDVVKATGLQAQQAKNALEMAAQLRLISAKGAGAFIFAGDANIRRAPKSGLPQFFREALQQFPPYLLFLSYLARDYESLEASRFSCTAFDIGLAPARVAEVYQSWGRHAGIIGKDGTLDFSPKDILDFGFLGRLTEALRDEIGTKTFVINELGANTWAHIQKAGVDVDGLSRGLKKHSDSPRDALREIGNVVEAYLASIAVSGSGPKAQLGQLLDSLSGKSTQQILKTHKNIGYGVTGFRNASDHGSDPDTGKEWSVSPEAALVGTLLGLLLLRSVVRFRLSGEQYV